MPMRSLNLYFLLLLLALSSYAQSVRESSLIKQRVAAVMNEQSEAWNRGDVEGFMQGYWKSDDLVFTSGDNVTRGWQSTLDRYKKTYDTREKMGELTFSDLEVTVLARDAAVVLGSWSLKRANDNPHGKFTLIFRKFKEGWRIIHDHTS